MTGTAQHCQEQYSKDCTLPPPPPLPPLPLPLPWGPRRFPHFCINKDSAAGSQVHRQRQKACTTKQGFANQQIAQQNACVSLTNSCCKAQYKIHLAMITSLCSMPHQDGSPHPSCRLWTTLLFQLPGQLLSVCGTSLPPPLILF